MINMAVEQDKCSLVGMSSDSSGRSYQKAFATGLPLIANSFPKLVINDN
jgi:hypothetical protein